MLGEEVTCKGESFPVCFGVVFVVVGFFFFWGGGGGGEGSLFMFLLLLVFCCCFCFFFLCFFSWGLGGGGAGCLFGGLVVVFVLFFLILKLGLPVNNVSASRVRIASVSILRQILVIPRLLAIFLQIA